MSTSPSRLRFGIIDDARSRERRFRLLASAAVVAAVVVGVAAYRVLGDDSTAGYVVPPPGHVTGSLRPVSLAGYPLWVTPSLWPGNAAVTFQDGGAYSSASPYAQPALPIGSVSGPVRAPVPRHFDPNYVLIVPAGVAALRVGRLGIASARGVGGLPLGEKVVAFRVPFSAGNSASAPALMGGWNDAPQPTITALDGHGNAIATISFPPLGSDRAPVTSRGGRCAVTSTRPGLTDAQIDASTAITPTPAGVAGVFLSCLDDRYAYRGAYFNVAILLNAHHPGQFPAPLWNATAVPRHAGVVELKPPRGFPGGQDTTAPLFARRVGDAWLVVQSRPGFARDPSIAQTIEILDAMRITRIDVQHPELNGEYVWSVDHAQDRCLSALCAATCHTTECQSNGEHRMRNAQLGSPVEPPSCASKRQHPGMSDATSPAGGYGKTVRPAAELVDAATVQLPG